MEKLDAKFFGVIHKVKNYDLVPEDEWCVFLAKDNAFARMLPHYRRICAEMGADAEQIHAVDRMIARVEAWRAAHPDRLKVPDAQGERLLDDNGAAPNVPRYPKDEPLSKMQRNEHTSDEVASIASKVLNGHTYTLDELKKLAASALTQAKDRT